jgi:putative colanic acid biosynthesis UDP-glucose lipid carrier transferase
MLSHTELYAQSISCFMLRHCALPGITGWAQIHGYRGPTKELSAMEQRVQADLWYLQNWSLKLDCVIVFRTMGLWLNKQPNAC